jgi:hypothetical protein
MGDADVVLRSIAVPHKRNSIRRFSKTYATGSKHRYLIDSDRLLFTVPVITYTDM